MDRSGEWTFPRSPPISNPRTSSDEAPSKLGQTWRLLRGQVHPWMMGISNTTA